MQNLSHEDPPEPTRPVVAALSTTFQTTKPPGRATIFKVQHANVQTRS